MIQNEISRVLAQMTAQASFGDEQGLCQVYRGCTNLGPLKGPEGSRACQTCLDRYKKDMADKRRKEMEEVIHAHWSRDVTFPRDFLDMKCDPDIRAINPDAWVASEGWSRKENAYIFGPVGVGKTYMANLMLYRFMFSQKYRFNNSVHIISARRLCKVSDRFDEGKGLLKHLEDADVLLLDDLDKGNWNTERLGALWELLDVRSAAKRSTIVTANVNPNDMRDVLRASTGGNTSLADATLDRMKPCITIQLNGKSQRT